MSMPAPKADAKAEDGRTALELGPVLPMTAEVKDDHLFIGGVDMVKLAKEQGTALYVFDQADLEHRMESYLNAMRVPASEFRCAIRQQGIPEQGCAADCGR